MDFNAIKDLITSMDNSKLDYLKVNWQGIDIVMKKNGEPIESIVCKQVENTTIATNESIQDTMVETAKIEEAIEEKVEKKIVGEEKLTIIKSPIVGTFYATPSPDKGPFAEVGTKVKKGDVLCIIEAMKLMNEIESEVNGEVVEVLVSNEQMVEYGQPLFKIK